MSSAASEFALSPLEEERFGIRTARVPWMTPNLLPTVTKFCGENHVKLLIANCRSSERSTIQAMERDGFLWMDTIVCLERDLTRPLPPPGSVTVRSIRPDEEEAVAALATQAFRGYVSHYHADSRLDPSKCDEVYPDWVRRSCRSRDANNEVVVAEADGAIVGLLILRLSGPQETISPLAGVLPGTRRQGILSSLAIHVLEWSVAKKATRTYAMVQLTNVAMQRAIQRVGFEPSYSYHMFHKWFDR